MCPDMRYSSEAATPSAGLSLGHPGVLQVCITGQDPIPCLGEGDGKGDPPCRFVPQGGPGRRASPCRYPSLGSQGGAGTREDPPLRSLWEGGGTESSYSAPGTTSQDPPTKLANQTGGLEPTDHDPPIKLANQKGGLAPTDQDPPIKLANQKGGLASSVPDSLRNQDSPGLPLWPAASLVRQDSPAKLAQAVTPSQGRPRRVRRPCVYIGLMLVHLTNSLATAYTRSRPGRTSSSQILPSPSWPGTSCYAVARFTPSSRIPGGQSGNTGCPA